MFLFFDQILASCSYKIVLIKKSVYMAKYITACVSHLYIV